MDLKKVETIKPFTRFLMTIGELPSSYLVSMTYEEQLLWFCNFLQNTVIPTVNNNAEAVIELQEFVSNYFENLDVQEEINNKLDEMAESGELTEIIAEYLKLAALFCYDTIADMAASENLDNGSSVYCLGKDTYNDGKGAFYKIREITSGDVVDGYNIVAITDNVNLIGERLPNYEINTINSTLETLTETTIPGIEEDLTTLNETTIPGIQADVTTINETTIPGIQDEIDTINETTIPNAVDGLQEQIDELKSGKKMIVIGDSYSNTNQSDGPLWYTYIASWHNLTAYTTASDGVGYATGTNTFLAQLQTAYNDSTLDNDDVKEIYILGGLNDIGNTGLSYNDFYTAVSNTLTYAITNFPSAMIYVIGILPFQFYNFYSGNSCLSDSQRAYNLQAFLSYACAENLGRVVFRNGEYLGLNIPGYFKTPNLSNQCHPSSLGQKVIANFVENGEKQFGFTTAENNCNLKDTPLTTTNGNGTVSINCVQQNSIGINVSNYDNTVDLKISMSGLPMLDGYFPITDEKGHCSFMYRWGGDNTLNINPGSGLDSGTLFLTLPWNLGD